MPIRSQKRITFTRWTGSVAPESIKKQQRLHLLLVAGGWGCQGSINLWLPGPEDQKDCPVEEELGDWLTLARQRETVSLPVSCQSMLWAGSWRWVRWSASLRPVTSVAKLEGSRSVGAPSPLEVTPGMLPEAGISVYPGRPFSLSCFSLSLNTLNTIFNRSLRGYKATLQSLKFSLCLSLDTRSLYIPDCPGIH